MELSMRGINPASKMTGIRVSASGLQYVIVAPESDPMAAQRREPTGTDVCDVECANGTYNIIAVGANEEGRSCQVSSGKVNIVKKSLDPKLILQLQNITLPSDTISDLTDAVPMDALDAGMPPAPPASAADAFGGAGNFPNMPDADGWNDESGFASANAEASAEAAPAVADPQPVAVVSPAGSDEVRALSAENARLTRDNADLRTKNQQLREQGDPDDKALTDTKLGLISALNEMTGNAEKMHDQNSTLSALLDGANRLITTLRKQKADLTSDRDTLKKELEAKQQQADDEKARADGLAQEVSSLKSAAPEAPMNLSGAPSVAAPSSTASVQVIRHEHVVKLPDLSGMPINVSLVMPNSTPLSTMFPAKRRSKQMVALMAIAGFVVVVLSVLGIVKVFEGVGNESVRQFGHAMSRALSQSGLLQYDEVSTPVAVPQPGTPTDDAKLRELQKRQDTMNAQLLEAQNIHRTLSQLVDRLTKLIDSVPHLKVKGGQIMLPTGVAPQGATQWGGGIGSKSLANTPVDKAIVIGDSRGFAVLFFFGGQNNGYLGHAVVLIED